MTAAKSKAKSPEEEQKKEDKDKPKEKTRSDKTKSETTKRIKEEKPPRSTSNEPRTGERKEICKEGPRWEECKLTCKVQTEHVSKDCRCKMHEKGEWKDTHFKPPTDTTLEEFRRESRFKPPTKPSQDTLEE